MAPGSERFWLGGILLGTALAYLRSLGNGFVCDDRFAILANPHLARWSFLWKQFAHDESWFEGGASTPRYRPVVENWFGILYHLFGTNPFGWHAASLAVHLIAVYLVFSIARRLIDDSRGALIAALMFGLLPVHAQAVMWISGISLLLSSTLELAALYILISRRSRSRWVVASGLYAIALLTHESAIAFPPLVAAYAYFLESAREPGTGPPPAGARLQRACAWAAPFFVEVLMYMLVRKSVLGFFVTGPYGATGSSLSQTLMTIPRVLLTDLVFLLVPSTAGISHRQFFVTNADSRMFVLSVSSPDFYLPVLALAGLAASLFYLLRNTRRRVLYLFCLVWIVLALSPMLHLRGIVEDLFVQDDYLYMSSAGLCVMAADLLGAWASAAGSGNRSLVTIGTAALVAIWVPSLVSLAQVWHDDITLTTQCIRKYPDSSFCHEVLGLALKRSGDFGGAAREIGTALGLDPWDYRILYELAEVHALLGRTKDATEEMARALSATHNPDAAKYVTLAQLYDLSGDQGRSQEALKRAQALPGGAELAGVARAEILLRHGEYAEAVPASEALAALYPAEPKVWTQLGSALASLREYEKALQAFDRALKLAPEDSTVLFLIAKTLHLMGRDRQALEECRAVEVLNPGDPFARQLAAEIEHKAQNP